MLLLVSLAAAAPPLCGVGDLHGDEAHAFEALRMCGAVDRSGSWIGGNMTVVQTGDVVDRGNASLPLLHALWSLREQAAAAGGELLLLMGNHELLNMQGQTRYVHKGELFEFGGVAAWLHAMNPRHGEIGARLAAQPGVAVRGQGACRTLFLHAGLRLRTAQSFATLDALNAELSRQAAANAGELLDAHTGPLWWRGYARPHAAGMSDEQACTEARDAIATLGDGAVRMAVGHNIVPFVSTRCGGLVHMIDVGMSYAYEGRPAVWQCTVDDYSREARVRAQYRQGEEPPPDLCAACAQVLGSLRGVDKAPLRGTDPHGDCRNYCSGRPERAMLKANSGISSLFGSWSESADNSVKAEPTGNHVKVEF